MCRSAILAPRPKCGLQQLFGHHSPWVLSLHPTPFAISVCTAQLTAGHLLLQMERQGRPREQGLADSSYIGFKHKLNLERARTDRLVCVIAAVRLLWE